MNYTLCVKSRATLNFFEQYTTFGKTFYKKIEAF